MLRCFAEETCQGVEIMAFRARLLSTAAIVAGLATAPVVHADQWRGGYGNGGYYHHHHNNNAATAAIVGGLVGLGVGAAIASGGGYFAPPPAYYGPPPGYYAPPQGYYGAPGYYGYPR